MLRHSELERRRLRDDADAAHEREDRYRDGVRLIEDMGLEPDEHMARVQRLAEELGI